MAAASGSLIMGMSSASSAISQANAARAKGAYDTSIANINARTAKDQAEDAIDRGNKAANQVRRQGKKVAAGQRLSAAAQGISATEGDIADLIDETELFSELDATTIRTNAIKEAYGYETQALNASAAGEFAGMAAENSARNTVLTGGMQALGYGLEGIEKSKKAKAEKEKAGR
jgi:hypothetical protein